MSEKRVRVAIRVLILLCGLSRLCPPALANTTTEARFRDGEAGSFLLAKAPSIRDPLPPTTPAAARAVMTPMTPAVRSGGRVKVALLLPLRSSTFKPAAEMVRAGFKAAYERDRGNNDITIIETDDSPHNIVALYRDALARYDVIVGPLSRTGVAAIAAGGSVTRPTIALAQPESVAGAAPVLPAKMIVVGLSVEDDARQAADWASREHPGAKALILYADVAWQRRAGKAFLGQWQKSKAGIDTIEMPTVGGYLKGNGLDELKKRLQTNKPGLIFVALDSIQTRQLRNVIGNDIALYGTSQLNPASLSEASSTEPHPDLDGVHLMDMPWQLALDHPAVMIYPRPASVPEQRRSPDFERLYALGIDAYRVAAEIGAGHDTFDIDGVTGRLSVQFDGIKPAVFQRTGLEAIYVKGMVEPMMPALLSPPAASPSAVVPAKTEPAAIPLVVAPASTQPSATSDSMAMPFPVAPVAPLDAPGLISEQPTDAR